MQMDSPRSRGWTLPVLGRRTAVTGFPALAGMDPAAAGGGSGSPRIPRARGDGPCLPISSAECTTDSPRSRGWTPRAVPRDAPAIGFPALAGMDP